MSDPTTTAGSPGQDRVTDSAATEWGVICPDGTVFQRLATEYQAAELAANIDVGGQRYPFHAMVCGPHDVRRLDA